MIIIIDHPPLFELRKEIIYLRLVVCWSPGLGPRRTDCSMFCLSITLMVGEILQKKRENNIKWSWDWKCLPLFRIGKLPPLPSHCGRLCHHVGLIFCRQGWRKMKLLHFECFLGLGDSHLRRGSYKPVLCSANHLCQGKTQLKEFFPHICRFFPS